MQVVAVWVICFGIAYAAEALNGADPDLLPLTTKGWVVFYTLLGWGAAELDSLADLINENAKLRLGVGKKFLASVAAGLFTGFGMLTFPQVMGYTPLPKLVAYGGAFAAAFGGAAYVTTISTALAGAVGGLIQRIFNVKPKD